MAKTIKQIADELGVSKQAVWQRIKRNVELRQSLEAHSESRSGTVYIDEQGEEAIKAAYAGYLKGVNVDETPINIDMNVDDNALIATLQSTVNALQEQLSTKDKQIDELTSMLRTVQEQAATLTNALTAAQALHAATVQERLEERAGAAGEVSEVTAGSVPEPQEQRRGFWTRLFRR